MNNKSMEILNSCENPHKILKEIFSCICHAVILVNDKGLIQFANESVNKIFGYKSEEVIDKSLSIFFTEEDLPFLYPNLLTLSKNNRSFQGELLLARKDGSRFFAYIEFKPCTESIKNEKIIVFSVVDIDKSKRLEFDPGGTQFADLVKIADGIAHELRNPITGIGGFVGRLYNSCKSMEKHEHYFKYITDNVNKIEYLIKKIEFLTKMPTLVISETTTREITERAIEQLLGEMENRDITPLNKVKDEKIYIDVDLSVNALTILLDNAIDVTDDGGNIEITDEFDENKCFIHIDDQGSGISKKDMPNIFTPFFTTKTDGAGLGLSIVKRIMQRHGGTVEASANESGGTRFTLMFPKERRRPIRIKFLDK